MSRPLLSRVPGWSGRSDVARVDLYTRGSLYVVVWFLLGFAVYSLLFGGFAALISRQEEIGAVTTPIMLLLFVPFYVSMFMVSNDPSSPVVQVLSQIPFFSPFMMPVRDVYGGVALWEILLAIGIALATIPLLVLFVVTSKQFVAGIMQGAVKG